MVRTEFIGRMRKQMYDENLIPVTTDETNESMKIFGIFFQISQRSHLPFWS